MTVNFINTVSTGEQATSHSTSGRVFDRPGLTTFVISAHHVNN